MMMPLINRQYHLDGLPNYCFKGELVLQRREETTKGKKTYRDLRLNNLAL